MRFTQDLETVEDWNEHGELEDQIEDQIDIFGDVPISATSVEAHAAAAARLEAQKASSSSQGRTASETRHISISDPKSDARRQSEDNPAGSLGDGKRDTHSPLSMAMRQAGAEAAAKAGQSSSGSSTGTSGTSGKTATISTSREPSGTTVPAPTPAKVPKLDAGAEEVSQVETGAKTPEQLASQGQSRTSVDKLGGSLDGEGRVDLSLLLFYPASRMLARSENGCANYVHGQTRKSPTWNRSSIRDVNRQSYRPPRPFRKRRR